MSKNQFARLTGFSKVELGEPGQYPWDDWERAALAGGVEKDLANLGRAVMREAYQHDWNLCWKVECGWNDEGRKMIALALRSPVKADERWSWLLASDGERRDPESYEWIGEDSWAWPQLRREWKKRRSQEAAQ